MTDMDDKTIRKIKLLFDKQDFLGEQQKWQGKFLHDELGYTSNPEQPKVVGEINKELYAIKLALNGPEDKMGIKTKLLLLWRGHGMLYTLLGLETMWIVKDLVK